jgi:RNA polymerase sigma-70 factor (ECF subfamily)
MDRELVKRAREGDEAAFETLAMASHARLYRLARGILRDGDQADDAVQRTLVQMWRKLRQLRDPERFEAWTYRLLVNACHDEVRHGRDRARVLPVDEIREPTGPDELHTVEDNDQLERGFGRLSLEHRSVVVLRYLLDLPIEQMAEILDVPGGTVSSRLHRAMTELRAAIEADARAGIETRNAEGALR